MGVFLFVGPSSVGKTERPWAWPTCSSAARSSAPPSTCRVQEKHTVSRLIGSPPGYIGYGEGGVLTEAVRQRPYSVVLLDEVEKAHPSAQPLLQVFDKGMLSDGEGQVVDFKDTIFLTSNLASDITMEVCGNGGSAPTWPSSTSASGRCSTSTSSRRCSRACRWCLLPIGSDIMREIVDLKLNRLRSRLMTGHKMRLVIEDEVLDTITRRCTMAETGARNIDYIINGSLLPRISTEVLEQMAEGAARHPAHRRGGRPVHLPVRGSGPPRRAQRRLEAGPGGRRVGGRARRGPRPPTLAPGPAEVDEVAAAETAMMEQMIAEAADAPAEVVVEEEPAIEQAAEPAIEQAVEAVAPSRPSRLVPTWPSRWMCRSGSRGPAARPQPALSPPSRPARSPPGRAPCWPRPSARRPHRVPRRGRDGRRPRIDGDA
ncbi:MAG: AAA family ATPase [bacterium]